MEIVLGLIVAVPMFVPAYEKKSISHKYYLILEIERLIKTK